MPYLTHGGCGICRSRRTLTFSSRPTMGAQGRTVDPRKHCVAKQRPERAEEDLVRLYLSDIGKHPLLTKADEARLAQQIEDGNAARLDLQKAEDRGEKLTVARRRE